MTNSILFIPVPYNWKSMQIMDKSTKERVLRENTSGLFNGKKIALAIGILGLGYITYSYGYDENFIDKARSAASSTHQIIRAIGPYIGLTNLAIYLSQDKRTATSREMKASSPKTTDPDSFQSSSSWKNIALATGILAGLGYVAHSYGCTEGLIEKALTTASAVDQFVQSHSLKIGILSFFIQANT